MTLNVDIVTDEVTRLLQLLDGLPASVLPAVLDAADEGSQAIILQAQKERFRGTGPFPVSKRRLGVVTGRLRGSLNSTRPEVTAAAQVLVRMGSNVKYFAPHEFGLEETVKVPGHNRRLPEGRRSRKPGPQLADAQSSYVRPHSRRMKVPKRAPLAAAIEEHAATIYKEVFSEKFAQLLDSI